MFGLLEIIRGNQLAVENWQKENTGNRLDKAGLINCLKQPGLVPQCFRCPYEVTCLQISQENNG